MNIDGLAGMFGDIMGIPCTVDEYVSPFPSYGEKAISYLQSRTSTPSGSKPDTRQTYNTTTNLISESITTPVYANLQLKVISFMGSDIYPLEYLSRLKGKLYTDAVLERMRALGFGLVRIGVSTSVPASENDTAVMEMTVVFSESNPGATDNSWIETANVSGPT